MQWPHFFNNTLYINYSAGESVPISRTYGFVWTFIAGIPWAGLGACALAWCASGRRTLRNCRISLPRSARGWYCDCPLSAPMLNLPRQLHGFEHGFFNRTRRNGVTDPGNADTIDFV